MVDMFHKVLIFERPGRRIPAWKKGGPEEIQDWPTVREIPQAFVDRRPELSEDEILALMTPPDAVNVIVMDRDRYLKAAPKDRTFRQAWTFDGDRVRVDMPKARTVKMRAIREERNDRLKALDEQEIRHLEDPTKLARVRALKRKLRDLPAMVDLEAINQPNQLRDFRPADLDEDP